MANYCAASRTNYFRVTDEEAYAKLFANLCGEGGIHDFSKTVGGIVYHGFGCYGSVEYVVDSEDEEYGTWDDGFGAFIEGIQEILPPDDAFIYMESGNEKLRYVTGFSVIVTKDKVEYINIAADAAHRAANMLGIKDYETQLDY